MKKIPAMLLAAVMLLAMLTACGGNNAADAGNTANAGSAAEEKPAGWWKEELQTVNDGVLTVATSPDFAPYEFYAIDENGEPQLAGFDMALAQYVADYMGLELEVIPMDFDGVLMDLQTKSVDLGMAGLSPDPKRMNAMDFSDIYYEGGQSFVTVKDNAEAFASLEDTNNASYAIGAQTASIQYNLAMENSPDANIIALPKVTDIVSELLSGKLDGAYIETAVALSYQINYPDLEIVLDVPYDVAGSAIGVQKDNEALLAGVNEAIAAALADGSLDDFVAQANEQASGNIYEGVLDANGQIQEAGEEEAGEAAA